MCTFLLPYWGQGKEFNDAAGNTNAAASSQQAYNTVVAVATTTATISNNQRTNACIPTVAAATRA